MFCEIIEFIENHMNFDNLEIIWTPFFWVSNPSISLK